MENNFDNTYKIIENKNKSSFSFSKNIFVPFISGILGSALVIGSVWYFPGLKNQLFENDEKQVITSSSVNESKTNSTNYQTISSVSLTNYSDTAIGVAKKVLPSIVGIKVEFPVTSSFYMTNSTTSSSGSGIIISEDGYILTNNHIVSSSSSNSFFYSLGEASKVIVYLYDDETPCEAKIIGTDEITDLAVLKIEKTGLTAAELGNSDTINVGEFAMAIGNPIGLKSSVTCGIISALNRNIKTSDATYNVIQTDAAINSGNSGGALVNSQGKVIGINTLKISSTGVEGIGFAIPINSTKEIYQELIKNGKIARPYLGVTTQTIDEETAKKYNLVSGAYIRSISDFSPAQKANLQVGDVITAINNEKITTSDELSNKILSYKIGDTIDLNVFRNGNNITINVTLEEEKN